MAAAAILKIHFNGYNSVTIYRKFGSDKNQRPGNRNNFKFHFSENPRWQPAAILKHINRHNSAAL